MVHDLNLHITELSLLGEMVADWDSTDVNEYHSLRLEVDSIEQSTSISRELKKSRREMVLSV